MEVQNILLNEIYPDPEFNCRGAITPSDVIDLAKNIREHGLLQPITVQPHTLHLDKGYKYRIIVGHRRFSAFQVLEEKTIPAIIKEGLSDIQARALNLDENLQRKALTILQEAKALVPFRVAGLTIHETAKMIKMSPGWVQIRFTLLNLPIEIQKEADAGFLNQEQIRDISNLPTIEDQFEAVKQIKESKFRGERSIKVKKKKTNPYKKKDRDKGERNRMLEHVLDTVGPCLASRTLAWTNGEISDIDLYNELKDYAKEKGIRYEVPKTEMPILSNA